MRVLFKTGSTITDVTSKVENYKVDSYAMTYAAGDAIYIGSDFPFNHFYLKLGDTVNAIASVPTFKTFAYTSTNQFNAAVDKTDLTNGLFNSGFMEFVPDRFYGWQARSTNDRGIEIEELNTVYIYDLYWMKLTFSATMTAGVVLKWIGQKFSDDNDLFGEYPIFNDGSMMVAFEEGKTNWEEQSVIAAQLMVKDLKARKIIIAKEQVLDREHLRLASVSKTAQLIFNSFGKDYFERAMMAKKEYEERLTGLIGRYDENNDAILDPAEKMTTTGWLSR